MPIAKIPNGICGKVIDILSTFYIYFYVNVKRKEKYRKQNVINNNFITKGKIVRDNIICIMIYERNHNA